MCVCSDHVTQTHHAGISYQKSHTCSLKKCSSEQYDVWKTLKIFTCTILKYIWDCAKKIPKKALVEKITPFELSVLTHALIKVGKVQLLFYYELLLHKYHVFILKHYVPNPLNCRKIRSR